MSYATDPPGAVLRVSGPAAVTAISWLAVRFMGHDAPATTVVAEADLTCASEHAFKNLKPDQIPQSQPSRSRVTEMQACLFAISDCFGVPGYEDRAISAPKTPSPILTQLASADSDRARILRRVLGHLRTCRSSPPSPLNGGKPDLSEELLEKLKGHPDPATTRLSEWALSLWFAPNKWIRPLQAVVEHASPTTSPIP
jgi:hypothetical protein